MQDIKMNSDSGMSECKKTDNKHKSPEHTVVTHQKDTLWNTLIKPGLHNSGRQTTKTTEPQ